MKILSFHTSVLAFSLSFLFLGLFHFHLSQVNHWIWFFHSAFPKFFLNEYMLLKLLYIYTSHYPFTLERKYINLNISDKTGSRLWKIIIIDVWSYWTRKCAVKNLKISQLVHEILAKNRFSWLIWRNRK